jgi:hypothetical protein
MLQRCGQCLHCGSWQLKALDQRPVGHQMPLPTCGIKLSEQSLPVLAADGY